MAKHPPSIGDSKAKYSRVQEMFPLPDTRREVVAKFEQILNSGGVQKVVIEMNNPIRVDRLIPASEIPEVEEVPDADLISAARNSEVIEFSSDKDSPFETLFKAFQFVSKKKLRASVILVHQMTELLSWLGLGKFEVLEDLFGVEVRVSMGVQEHSALILTSELDDPSIIVSTLKLDLFKDQAREANHRKGTQERNSGERNGRAPGEVGQPS